MSMTLLLGLWLTAADAQEAEDEAPEREVTAPAGSRTAESEDEADEDEDESDEEDGADEEAEEPEDEPRPKKSSDSGSDGVGGFIGVQVGPVFSLSPLGTSFTPRLETGITLPAMDNSWRIFVSAQWFRPVATGTADSTQVASGKFDYELKQDELIFGLGPMFRAGMLDGPVIPEIAVGPTLHLNRSTVNGSTGGSPFGESVEEYTRFGIYAAGGIEVEAGPGELTLLLTFGSAGFNGVVTGQSASTNLTPTLGYRLVI